jgi:SAM-dependent methyltransferase
MEVQRWLTMPEAYDRLCQRLVPQYDWLQAEALRLAALPDDRDTLVVDLGGGSGHFLDKVLATHPRAHACWVDASPAFHEIAARRLAPYAERVRYVISRFEEPWEAQVGAPADLIVSMSAIHHLDSAGKADLYRRCYAALVPGGWFINVDEMATLNRDAYLASLRRWVRHVAEARKQMSPEELPYYYTSAQIGLWYNGATRNRKQERSARCVAPNLRRSN